MIRIFVPILMFTATVAQADPPPNILMILADDLGWTDTSVQMDLNEPNSKSDFYQTPNLEAMAAAGMKFSNAYAVAPVCSPTRASIQTGKTTAQLHMTDITAAGEPGVQWRKWFYEDRALIPPMPLAKLPLGEVTIPEYLKAGNPSYFTSHHQRWHLNTPANELPYKGDERSQGYDVANTGYGVFPAGTDPKLIAGTASRAIDAMETAIAAGRPFYTQVSFFGVHTPYEALPATIDKYENLPPGQRHDQPLYAAMVEELDAGVGTLLDKLDELGIADNTYVVFFSDNGGRVSSDATTNAPLFDGKGAIWEGGLRVPLIVRGPSIQANSASDVPVISYDLLSTFGDMAGVTNPEPAGVEGTSLLPLLENGGVLPAGALSMAHGPNGKLFFHYPHYISHRTPTSAIRDGDYKLVRVYGQNGAPDGIYLFDFSATLTESSILSSPFNLASSMPAQTALMLGKLDAWLAAVGAGMPEPAGGDFNGDNIVDLTDLADWENYFGTIGVQHAEGDANGDAFADGRDFLSWQRDFGSNVASLASSVPEPSAVVLGSFGMVFVMFVGRRFGYR